MLQTPYKKKHRTIPPLLFSTPRDHMFLELQGSWKFSPFICSKPYLTQNHVTMPLYVHDTSQNSCNKHPVTLHTSPHLALNFPHLQNILNPFLILEVLPLTPGSLTLCPHASRRHSALRLPGRVFGSKHRQARVLDCVSLGAGVCKDPSPPPFPRPHTHVSRKTQQPKLRCPQECGPGVGKRSRRAAGRRLGN